VTPDSLGRRLRAERERQQIALDAIAERTKIGIGLLKGLERDDVSRWPSGVYRRAFVHAYASELGMDGDAVAREFLERFADPEIGRPARSPTLFSGGLRLSLDGTPSAFSGGCLLPDPVHRLAAGACDAGLVLLLAAGSWALAGSFWASAALIALCYSAVSVLVLGNTPGVCLFSSIEAHETPVTEESSGLLTPPTISAISSSP
jgi:transcriptional regulator with XRE-family HTH domain